MKLKRFVLGFVLLTSVAFAADDNPETSAHLPSQAAADVLRQFAGTDLAFLAAGLVKTEYKKDDLATLLQYPTDEIVIVKLTGSQIKQALERSLSLFPQPNTSFLQLSGVEVTFLKNPPSGSRVQSVTVDGSKIEDSKAYTVAMPSSLGRGGLGYFKIWDKAKITKTFEKETIEGVLKGKKFAETTPRWVAQS